MAVVLQHGDITDVARSNTSGGPALSEDGWRQAETLADRVADLPITHLLAAPELACRQTLLPSAARRRRMVEPTDLLATDEGAEQLCQEWAAPGLEAAALCVAPVVLAKLLTALHERRDVDLDLPDQFSLTATTALVVAQNDHGGLLLRGLPGQSSPPADAGTPAAIAELEHADAALARLTSQREQLGARLVAMRSRLVASQQAWQQLSKQLQHESQQLVGLARVLVRRVDTATQMLGQLQQRPTAGAPKARQVDARFEKHMAEVHYRSAVLTEYVEHWLAVLDAQHAVVGIDQVAHSAMATALLPGHAGEEAPTTVWSPASQPADAAIVVRELTDQARLRHPRRAITVRADGELLVMAATSGIARTLGPLLDYACEAVEPEVPVCVVANARDLVVVLAVEVSDARTTTQHAAAGALSPVVPDWPPRGDLDLDAASRLASQHGSRLLAGAAPGGAGERFELHLPRVQPGTARTLPGSS